MRKTLRALVAAAGLTAVVGGILTVGTGSASAAETDRRPCVTLAEYRAIPTDFTMTRARPAAIFDTDGKTNHVSAPSLYGQRSMQRRYRVCGDPWPYS